MLIYLFSVILDFFHPLERSYTIRFWTTGFLTASGLKALILPSVTLSLFQMTYVIRLVRAEMMKFYKQIILNLQKQEV